MFFFGPGDRGGTDDYRPAVHDSDGLLMSTGRGEQVWRPLQNPRDLQVSVLGDTNPRGFGLMQRPRRFGDYQDLEARYERRPARGWNRSATGARAACNWWRSPRAARSTTTSSRSGVPRTR